MNNKEFITKLAKRCNITIGEATANVDAFVNVMTERLKDNDQLNISGFGVLEAKMRKERLSVNPKPDKDFLFPQKWCLRSVRAAN